MKNYIRSTIYCLKRVSLKASLITVFILTIHCFTKAGFTELVSIKIKQAEADVIVSVKAQRKIDVQFYLFTVNGNLIKQLNIKGSSKFSITHLSKGVYLYDIFNNDERLKSGRIDLK